MGFFVWFVCTDVQMQAGSTEAWQLAAALGGSLRSTALAQQDPSRWEWFSANQVFNRSFGM